MPDLKSANCTIKRKVAGLNAISATSLFAVVVFVGTWEKFPSLSYRVTAKV
jgi:hypothetical protein